MGSEAKDKKKNTAFSNKVKLLRAIVILAAIAALIAGLTYAWFFNRMDMATLMKIQPPSDISILGPSGQQIDSLDLSYTNDDKKDGTVTVKRVFCVQSTDDFKLELVHTTNLNDLNFKLYRAKKVSESTASTGNSITAEDGVEYRYENDPLKGSYINTASKPVKEKYKYANDTYHQKNYASYNNVQAHVEPIYWLAEGNDTSDINKLSYDKDNQLDSIDQNGDTVHQYQTYFVCEISWTETTKETDIFYIFAQYA